MKNKNISVKDMTFVPWYVIEEGKNKGEVRVPTLNFIEFLGQLNYRYARMGDSFRIVRIIDNVVFIVTDYSQIIETAIQWLDDNAKDNFIEGIHVLSIKTAWINKTPQLFSPLNLKFLPKATIRRHWDASDTCYLYFLDTAVKVTSNGYQCIPYRDLDGHVFKEQIINRNFKQ